MLLLAGLAFAAPLRAQQGDVTVKIDFISWGNQIDGLSFRASEKTGKITALPFRYSQPVTYSGPRLMELFKTTGNSNKTVPAPTADDLAQEGKPLKVETSAPSAEDNGQPKQGLALELEQRRQKDPSLVALVPLPAGCNRATVLLAPASDGTYQPYVIDDDPTKLPPGRLRVHNLCPVPILMRFNSKTSAELKTRDAVLVAPENGQVIYELAYKNTADEEWIMQENNLFAVAQHEQVQLIVLKSDNDFFTSSDGSRGGYLQAVILRRDPARLRTP